MLDLFLDCQAKIISYGLIFYNNIFYGSIDMKLKLSILISAFLLSTAVVAVSKLTIVSFGGAYGAAQKKHMLDPYTEKTGVELLFEDYSGGVAELKAQVESGNVKWDVLDIEYIDIERACSEGMLELFPHYVLPPGENGVPAEEDFIDGALNDCAVGNIVWSIIFAHKGTLQNKPTSIKDVFDTKKIPGKRAFRKRPQVNLEWALMADGVPKNKVYEVLETPAGVNRAFRKLDTIKDDIIWFESWSQAPQLLNDGGAVIVQSANGRIFNAIIQDKKDFEIVWDGQVYDLDGWAIVRGSRNKRAAVDFIKFTTGTLPLLGMQNVAYGPTRKSTNKYIADIIKPHLPSAHLDQGIQASAEFWSDNAGTLNEKFIAWLIR